MTTTPTHTTTTTPTTPTTPTTTPSLEDHLDDDDDDDDGATGTAATGTADHDDDDGRGLPIHVGFADRVWYVHKFGGTSVANATCFRTVANILYDQLSSPSSSSKDDTATETTDPNLAVVVSAMGGKPKTTDLLLRAVENAAARVDVTDALEAIRVQHGTCLRGLFPPDADDEQGGGEQDQERNRLHDIIERDLRDIVDILKTVSLMKWNASRIAQVVSGYGELWSTQILCALLTKMQRQQQQKQRQQQQQQPHRQQQQQQHQQHHFVYLDARRVITIDEDTIQNGGTVEWKISQDKLRSIYDDEWNKLSLRASSSSPSSSNATNATNATHRLHFIMTGYVASNTNGVATTLQRDGSDYSAAILGRLVRANGITIWTDVDGVLSADPRRVPACQVLPRVSYNEAMELAYFGAKVVHGKTMQPAITATPQIPIYIRNTFRSHMAGTRIYTTSSTTQHGDDRVVCGFSSIEHIALINVEGSGLIGVPGVARRLFGTLEYHRVNVILISQASSEHTVTFACTMAQATAAERVLREEFDKELHLGLMNSVEVKAPCSIIAAVGDGMFQTSGVSGRFFSALGDAKINVLAVAQGCSERNISAVVPMEDSTRALRAVHAAFRLSHTSIRVGIVGMNDLGESLLRLLDTKRAFFKSNFELDLQVCVILPHTTTATTTPTSATTTIQRDLVCLRQNESDTDDSINVAAYKSALNGNPASDNNTETSTQTSFADDGVAILQRGGLEAVLTHLYREEATNHVLFDCTNDESVGKYHSLWLKAGIDVVTANNTGLSGPKSQREAIRNAEKAYGKQSATYMREVTVGGGLPVISTMRQLLHSGDQIRRIDGILSTSLSYIMFRVSPPPHYTLTSKFDEELTQGQYCHGASNLDEPCSFSQAVKEAIALGLMEEDPTKDLNNEYTSRMLMVVARELGLDGQLETSLIQQASDAIVEAVLHFDPSKTVNYQNLPPAINEEMKVRVDAARARGNVLRHIASVDVKTKQVMIQLMEVPEHHVFACTPPSCEIVRFFTHRHKTYPLIVQGPSAGADSTASALVAELLNVMRGKVTPRSVALSRTGSHVLLKNTALPSQSSSTNSSTAS